MPRKKKKEKKDEEKNKPLLIPEKKSNEEILKEMLDTDLLAECINYQLKYLGEGDSWKREFSKDLFQDLCLVIMRYDNDKLNDAYWKGHSNALITAILKRQLISDSSDFYRKYIKYRRYKLPLEIDRGERTDYDF